MPASASTGSPTARAKVGYAVDRVFVYGTGGIAFGGVRIDNDHHGRCRVCRERVNRPDFDGRKGALRTGWVAGGGVEYAIGPHLSVKGEALYYDLGARTVLAGDASRFRPNVAAGTRAETSGLLGRVGLNYRFDDGLPVIGPVVDVARALIDPGAVRGAGGAGLGLRDRHPLRQQLGPLRQVVLPAGQ